MSTCVPQDHPVLLHLASLHAALARFQHDAHASAVKLQHHSLASSRALHSTHRLEHELSLLQSELDALRSLSASSSSAPLPPSHPASLHVHQLTLSLRSLSEKLDSTEHILAQRTHDLTATLSDLSKSKASTDAAYLLASRIRAREEASIARERDLELRLRIAEEKARMSEQTVTEYADLVRSLEARTTPHVRSASASGTLKPTPSTVVVEISFARERDELEARLAQVQHELAVVQAQLTAERQTKDASSTELARLRLQLQKLERDDNTAAKMVSRYMKFSQNSTDALQATLDQLKSRHTATLNTLHYQLYTLSSQLAASEATNTRLRHALDELGGDMLRESFGRRREVALRIKLVYREEWILEALRRWLRRSEEALGKSQRGTMAALNEMVQDAKIFIDALEDPVQIKEEGKGAAVPVSGSLARLIVVQDVVDELVAEAQRERVRRVKAEERLVKLEEKAALAALPRLEKEPLKNASERQSTEDLLGLEEGSVIEPLKVSEQIVQSEDGSADSLLLVQSGEEPAKEPEVLPSPVQPIEEPMAPPPVEEPISNDEPVTLPSPIQQQPVEDSMIPVPFTPPFPSEEEPSPHPLLKELEGARKRYEPLQRAFHDCHVALETLKSSLPTDRPAPRTPHIPCNILKAVLDRLDDFTEDVRVELEIRVSDEEVLGRGYEALLSVPGAIGSGGDEDGDVPVKDQVEAQVRAFVEGTEPGIQKANKGFENKLEELQHDIAVLKRAVYNPTMTTHLDDVVGTGGGKEESESELPDETTPSPGWTSWIPKSSSSSSANLTVPAPTFGSVMTSRGWKRSSASSSSSSSLSESLLPLKMAQDQDVLGAAGDWVAKLGLRIPMPSLALPGNYSHLHHQQQQQQQWMLGVGNGPRSKRTVSAMYMLGMGSAVTGNGSAVAGFPPVPMRRAVSAAPRMGGDVVGGGEEDVD